jgi:hypothetical protein
MLLETRSRATNNGGGAAGAGTAAEFVVQLAAETAMAHGGFAGRVEDVVSGQASHFHSLDELLARLERVLNALDSAQLI